MATLTIRVGSCLRKTFTVLALLYPLLTRYVSPIPNVTLAEFLTMLFWLFAVWTGKLRIRFATCLIPLCIYTLVQIALCYAARPGGESRADAVGTALRLLYLYVTIACLAKAYFDFELGFRYLRVIGMVVAGYALLQVVLAQFGVYPTTYLPLLKPMGINTDESQAQYLALRLQFRPCSLLNEPAHLCTYLLLPLTLELFLGRRRWWLYAAVYAMACLVSRSSTGIMMVILLAGLFLAQPPKSGDRRAWKRKVNMLIAAAIAIAVGGGVSSWEQIYGDTSWRERSTGTYLWRDCRRPRGFVILT